MADDGDVNFGHFNLIWDRLLGVCSDPGARDVQDGDLGITGRADYPHAYIDQLAEPFR